MTTSRIAVFVSAFTPRLHSGRSVLVTSLRPHHNRIDGGSYSLGLRGLSMSAGPASSTSPPPPGPPKPRVAGIVGAELKEELSRSYIEYAMSVIMGRAMPDVRDGLKPVHRRILYAMHDLGLTPSGRFRKSARVVGEVLGKYHPHGENAVYDALVRMSQSFSMCSPLVDGHGNFGSTDGDPAAAMRYTECRLTAITRDVMFADIGKDTVAFADNFDGSEQEPLVLPARLPNLLLNGSSGIAVGLATNIPPHNLGELTKALLALVANPDITDSQLMDLVPGPDFPTGGLILGKTGARDMYMRGRGQIVMRARVSKETVKTDSKKSSSRTALVVTELPYQVNKANLIGKIAELVNTKKLEGIADLRDESDRNGTRIVIELKRDAHEDLVLNNLLRKTDLQTPFSANVMALDNGQFPISLTLRMCLEKFLDFRRETIRRRTSYDLRSAKAREHLVDGFLVVQENADSIVKTIRASSDPASAKEQLLESFGLTTIQAESVLSMQLRRLTTMERNKLIDEKADLVKRIEEYTSILADSSRVNEIIAMELKQTSSQYAVKRRSEIVEMGLDDYSLDIDEKSLVPNEHSVIVVTEQGYMKRMDVSSFDEHHRNTKGKRGVGRMRDNDMVAHFVKCMTHDKLLVVSKNGRAYELHAYKVPLSSLSARGVPLFSLLPDFGAGQGLASVIPVSGNRPDECLILMTRSGLCLKTELSQFEYNNIRGKRIYRIKKGDELRWVRRCQSGDTVLISSEQGRVMRTTSDAIGQRNRGAGGVLTMKLEPGENVAGFDVIPGGNEEQSFLLLISSQGLGKRLTADLIPETSRNAKGRACFSMKNKEHVVSLHVCTEQDSVMLATRNGTITRMKLADILPKSRRQRGVNCLKVSKGDEVAAVTIIPKELVVEDD